MADAKQHSSLSPCAEQVRNANHARYICTLFAPDSIREDFFAIYAFYEELAAIRTKVSEPMLGLIRFQWWREAIAKLYQGKQESHEILVALDSVIVKHQLKETYFQEVINGFEKELNLDDNYKEQDIELLTKSIADPFSHLLCAVSSNTGDSEVSKVVAVLIEAAIYSEQYFRNPLVDTSWYIYQVKACIERSMQLKIPKTNQLRPLLLQRVILKRQLSRLSAKIAHSQQYAKSLHFIDLVALYLSALIGRY